MKQRSILGAAAVFAAMALPGFADGAMTDNLEITGGFARATAPSAMAGGAFLTIRSKGQADRLVAFTSPSCKRPELHTHIKDEGGVMRMRQVEAIEVPAGGEAVLEPGGLHLMCMGLTGALVEGEALSATLVFEQAGEVAVSLPIMGPGAIAAMEHSH